MEDIEQNEKKTLLIGSGREMAGMWLNSAVRDAASPEQMQNQIFCLQVACQHVLAVCAYNLIANGRHVDQVMADFSDEIEKELKHLYSEPMKKVKVKTKKKPHKPRWKDNAN